MNLPTPEDLLAAMLLLGCQERAGGDFCTTHNSSFLIHDGGRVACPKAWEHQS